MFSHCVAVAGMGGDSQEGEKLNSSLWPWAALRVSCGWSETGAMRGWNGADEGMEQERWGDGTGLMWGWNRSDERRERG